MNTLGFSQAAARGCQFAAMSCDLDWCHQSQIEQVLTFQKILAGVNQETTTL